MQTTQGSVLQSLRAVAAFLDANADRLAGVVKTGSRQQLADAIAELSNHVSDQTGSTLEAQGATQKHVLLRKELLRDFMAPISRIAKADLPQTPEVEPLRMPRGRPTTERLAAAAKGMAKAAAPFASMFIAAGLPQDFIAQLTAATDTMVSSTTERMKSRGKRTGATQGLKDKLIAGRKIVHVLDAFVNTALKDDPSLLANWNVVKRVQKVSGRPAFVMPPLILPTPTKPPTPTTPVVPPTPPIADAR